MSFLKRIAIFNYYFNCLLHIYINVLYLFDKLYPFLTRINRKELFGIISNTFGALMKIIASFLRFTGYHNFMLPGRVAQSVTCLATDACLTADPGVASSIPAWFHTFVEIDHEIVSTVILLPSADLFKKGCCQLQAKVCAQITGYPLAHAY